MARLPESGGHPYDATFRLFPPLSSVKPTRTQSQPNACDMSARGPFAFGFAADHRRGHVRGVAGLAVEQNPYTRDYPFLGGGETILRV